MKNWKFRNSVSCNNLTNSSVQQGSNSSVYQTTYATADLQPANYLFSLGNPADVVDQCIRAMNDSLWSVFTPLTASEILIKNAYPKVNVFLRDEQLPEDVHTDVTKKELVIDLFLPYVTQDDVEVEVDDKQNTITVSTKNVQEDCACVYLMRDVPRGASRQEIQLPTKDYSVKNVKADLRDGVLRLTITRNTPVEPEKATRKIKLG